MTSLQPWQSGSAYLLMVDESVDERLGWPAATWARLRDVRAATDPAGLFVAPHPATEG
jgi:hypothetical protein